MLLGKSLIEVRTWLVKDSGWQPNVNLSQSGMHQCRSQDHKTGFHPDWRKFIFCWIYFLQFVWCKFRFKMFTENVPAVKFFWWSARDTFVDLEARHTDVIKKRHSGWSIEFSLCLITFLGSIGSTLLRHNFTRYYVPDFCDNFMR